VSQNVSQNTKCRIGWDRLHCVREGTARPRRGNCCDVAPGVCHLVYGMLGVSAVPLLDINVPLLVPGPPLCPLGGAATSVLPSASRAAARVMRARPIACVMAPKNIAGRSAVAVTLATAKVW